MIDLSKVIPPVLFLLTLLLVAVSLCFIYFHYCFTYWKRKGVPSLQPKFPFGDIAQSALGKESLYTRLKSLYDTLKSQSHDYGGIYFFNGPVFMPINLDLTKQILQADFEHFVDRGVYHDKENMPLSYNLFAMEGREWKNLRAKMTPAFSSGKIKVMYEIMKDVADKLTKKLENLTDTEEEVNVKNLLRRFTIDIICSCALGLEANSLNKEESEFLKAAERVFDNSIWDFVKLFLRHGFTNFGAIVKLIYKDRRNREFFENIVNKTIIHRKENGIARNDFMKLLIEMLDEDKLSHQDVIAQTFLFFIAGFETSSNTMAYCLHELAHRQDIQDKLREEVHKAVGKNPQNLTYEQLSNIPYLDNVIDETLRLYPVLPVLNRVCGKDYPIPGTKVIIPKGTNVVIPLFAIGRDSEYFKDPTQFNPDRFQEKAFPSYAHIPFGEGPRFCIGKRFGQLQVKLGLTSLIARYKFEPSKTVPRHLTLLPCTTSLAFHTVEPVQCKVTRL